MACEAEGRMIKLHACSGQWSGNLRPARSSRPRRSADPGFPGDFNGRGLGDHLERFSGSPEVQALSHMTAPGHNRFYRVHSDPDWTDPPVLHPGLPCPPETFCPRRGKGVGSMRRMLHPATKPTGVMVLGWVLLVNAMRSSWA